MIVTIKQKETLPTVYKDAIFEEFILWSAMPPSERVTLGLENQGAFEEFHKVTRTTLWRWKHRKDYQPRVTDLRQKWAFDKTNHVIEGIYRSALKGNPHSQKLWLQYFLGFTEKAELQVTQKVEVSVNDIRFLIEGLPEPLRTKHYANLRDLLDDATMVRNAGLVDDSRLAEQSAIDISGEADHVSQDLPDKEAGKVSGRNKTSVCANMVGEIPTSNYQSSPRWR